MPDSELDYASIWLGTLATLTDAGLPAQQKAFLRLARFVGLIDSTALLAVPNDLTKDILEQRLRAQVTDALGSQLDREIRLAVTVDPALATTARPPGKAPGAPARARRLCPVTHPPAHPPDRPLGSCPPSPSRCRTGPRRAPRDPWSPPG